MTVETNPMRSAICCVMPCENRKSEMSLLGFIIFKRLRAQGTRLKVKG